MSAESPRRGSRGSGAVVRPQPVSDKSVMESVVDFFQDVAYSHTSTKPDDREKVQWVRFECADVNDINSNPDCSPQSGNTPPILLVLGYTNGIQIWYIPASGEAQEVFSMRQGPIKVLRMLPNPSPVFGRPDMYSTKRPLMAVCDASSAGQPYCCVKFLSLKSGDEVHKISFNHVVANVCCSERVIVVAFPEKVAAFDSCQFKQIFWITTCFPCPGPNPNPIALGSRWLAYADRKLIPVHQSGGGMTGDGGQSYAATVISAAKTITKGLTMFGETVASSITGKHAPPPKKDPQVVEPSGLMPGVVTIIDIHKVGDGQISVQEDTEGEGLVAHFHAHSSEPVSAMAFDPSGQLLLTADRLGHNFHVFRIMAHPCSCSLGAIHHLYTLHRGDTTAKVQDIAFSLDSRWVAISTLRGTTHVFPITPYGGPVTVRTHTSPRVVNRVSRFHRSAGLEDIDLKSSGRHSPVHLSGSPGSSPGRHEHRRHVLHQNALNNIMGNPRLPPYPHPNTSIPLAQVKQTLTIPGLGGTTAAGKQKSTNQVTLESVCVASWFAQSRGWVAGSPSLSRDKTVDEKPVDSLYIVNWTGTLIEYILEPHPKAGLEKITDDSPLDVVQTPRAQWNLCRSVKSSEMKPPLMSCNPLMVGHEAVVSQRPSSGDLSGGFNPVTRQESKESLASDHSGSARDDPDEQWLSQVEIITHAGPHRRLWMGPQFSFKTFQGSQTTTVLSSNSSVLLSRSPDNVPISTMDIVSEDVDLQSLKIQPARSSPVAMPGGRPRQHRHSSGSDQYNPSPAGGATLLIEADVGAVCDDCSQGSYEQSPSLLEAYSSWPETSAPVQSGEIAEERLRERLADAMIESPVKEGGPTARTDVPPRLGAGRLTTIQCELYHSSADNLSTSSGSASSAPRGHSYDARSSPPHSIEHVLVFPSGNGSPDSN